MVGHDRVGISRLAFISPFRVDMRGILDECEILATPREGFIAPVPALSGPCRIPPVSVSGWPDSPSYGDANAKPVWCLTADVREPSRDVVDRLRARTACVGANGTTADTGLDLIVVPPNLRRCCPRLVVTDVDSTLIMEEVIEELADRAGTRSEVARITHQAMNGELDFAESLTRRVATLAGIPSTVFDDVLSDLTFSPGARELIGWVHQKGGKFGVVSGGFEEVVAPLCRNAGIDWWTANRLEVRGGFLTGRVLGDIVTADTKVAALHRWAEKAGTSTEMTVAVGDGANDVPMLENAGLGVAFCAKPAVARQVSNALTTRRLDVLTHILGLVGVG